MNALQASCVSREAVLLQYQDVQDLESLEEITARTHRLLSMKVIARRVLRVLFAKGTVTTTVNVPAISSVINEARLMNLLLAVHRAVRVILLRRTIVLNLEVQSSPSLPKTVPQLLLAGTARATVTVTRSAKKVLSVCNAAATKKYEAALAMERNAKTFAPFQQASRSSPLRETATVTAPFAKVIAIVTAIAAAV
mmetsp:Transcript_52687/g.78684  ORF Transcript_52687/g.78684 Transcript_52687/m.78684 type:complete len:195 (-) Transcript_52687:1482-2066(-)